MSKLKPSTVEKQNDIIYANIKSRCAYFGYDSDIKASEKICMDSKTFYNRKRNGGWKSDELTMAAESLRVSFAWLVTDHSDMREVKQ